MDFLLTFIGQMQKLGCAVQHYAWGKNGRESFITKLIHAEPVDEGKQYAEVSELKEISRSLYS